MIFGSILLVCPGPGAFAKICTFSLGSTVVDRAGGGDRLESKFIGGESKHCAVLGGTAASQVAAPSEDDGEEEARAAFLSAVLDDEEEVDDAAREAVASYEGSTVLCENADAVDSDAEPKATARRSTYMWNWSAPSPSAPSGAKNPGDYSAQWFFEQVERAHIECDAPRLAYGACAKERHAAGSDGQRAWHMHVCTKTRDDTTYGFKAVKKSRETSPNPSERRRMER